MPKVNQVVARKDYPQYGIVKGEKHFHWKIKQPRGGIEYRSKTAPKRSQLTTSAFLGPLYDIQDSIDAVAHTSDASGDLRSIAEEVTALGEEQREKFDNMPEGFQQGATGEMLDERATGCEDWAQEIEQAADELDGKIEEINALEPHEIDDLEAPDPDDDEDDDTPMPTDDEIEAARAGMIATAAEEAIDAAGSACPF